jgi:hypothetical protein
LTEIEATSGTTPPVVQPGLVRARLGELERLLREDIARARVELQKHLEGDLRIRGLPAKADEPGRPFELTGRVKADSLLALENQEAVCLQVVAGARFGRQANTSVEFRLHGRA